MTHYHIHISGHSAFPAILGKKAATSIRNRKPVADTFFLYVVADRRESDGHCMAGRPSDRILTLLVAIKPARLLLIAVLNLFQQLHSAVSFPYSSTTTFHLQRRKQQMLYTL
jgi:hypothetical protein